MVMFFFGKSNVTKTEDTAPCGYSLCAGARTACCPYLHAQDFKTSRYHSSPNLSLRNPNSPSGFRILSWLWSLKVQVDRSLQIWSKHVQFINFLAILYSHGWQERLGAPYRNIRGRDIGGRAGKRRWVSSSTHLKNNGFLMFHADFPPKNKVIQ